MRNSKLPALQELLDSYPDETDTQEDETDSQDDDSEARYLASELKTLPLVRELAICRGVWREIYLAYGKYWSKVQKCLDSGSDYPDPDTFEPIQKAREQFSKALHRPDERGIDPQGNRIRIDCCIRHEASSRYSKRRAAAVL